jgi:3',5'-nucleoside bisphosphate phosphatase
MTIDLHLHSTESDGTYTPEQLIDAAKEGGIDTVALCDHDTISGIDRFIKYSNSKGIRAIAGVEISAMSIGGECHILGLHLSLHSEELECALQRYPDLRIQRNYKIFQKLQLLGYDVEVDDILKYAQGTTAGRPHIARLLVDIGAAENIEDAFRKYLVKGASAYVERFRFDPYEMVALLKSAGATVVLAHPGLLKMTEEQLYDFVSELVEKGLDALEVYTPHNTDEQITMLEKTAEKLKLLCSGGSDFHGENKVGHVIGYYRNGSLVPDCVNKVADRKL